MDEPGASAREVVNWGDDRRTRPRGPKSGVVRRGSGPLRASFWYAENPDLSGSCVPRRVWRRWGRFRWPSYNGGSGCDDHCCVNCHDDCSGGDDCYSGGDDRSSGGHYDCSGGHDHCGTNDDGG